MSFHPLRPKDIGAVLLLKSIFRHRTCFLSSVATDSKSGHRLKVKKKKIRPPFLFSSFNAKRVQNQVKAELT